jgi:hypothetical protein
MAPIGLSVQVVASPMIIIQMTLEVSCMLLENIYSAGITPVNCHLQLSHFYSTSPCGLYYKDVSIVNDDSQVVKSNAPSCGVTYDRH